MSRIASLLRVISLCVMMISLYATASNPTGQPTSMPTPHVVTRVEFWANNTLANINPYDAFNLASTQQDYIDCLVKYMKGVTVGQIDIKRIATTNPVTVLHPMLRTAAISTVLITWSASYDTFQVQATSSASAISIVQNSLTSAVTTGNLLAALVAANPNVFGSASISSLQFGTQVISQQLRTATPTFRPTKSPEPETWQEDSINWIKTKMTLAGFVIFVLAVVFLYCMCGFGMALHYRLERQAITKEQIVQRHIVQPRISLQDRARMRMQNKEEVMAEEFDNAASGGGAIASDEEVADLTPAQRARLKLKRFGSVTSPSSGVSAPESPNARDTLGINSPTPTEIKAKTLSRSKSRNRLRSVEMGSPVSQQPGASSVLRGAVARMQEERLKQRENNDEPGELRTPKTRGASGGLNIEIL